MQSRSGGGLFSDSSRYGMDEIVAFAGDSGKHGTIGAALIFIILV